MSDWLFFIHNLQEHLWFSVVWVFALFFIHFINASSRYALNVFGVIPRRWYGLPGILLSSFLHGNYSHLLFNSLPLLVLMNVLLLQFPEQLFLALTSNIVLFSGALTWLFGRRAIHIGASSLVLGYMGFLIMLWLLERSQLNSILIFIVIYYIGGILGGLMPQDRSTSWEGHIFGFLSGLYCAAGYLEQVPLPLWLRDWTEYPGQLAYAWYLQYF